MNSQLIKDNVKDYYGSIALNGGCCDTGSAGSGCCEPASAANTLTLFAEPADTTVANADLGLSCGSPTLFAAIQAGDTVLDLGSGAGVDVFRAAQIAGAAGHVIGVDMTEAMIQRAQDNARQGSYRNVEFRLGDIEALPVDNASVDVALSNCVINLAPDKGQVFAEIYRVLKPGGRFSVSDIVTEGAVPDTLRGNMDEWCGCVSGALDRDEYLGVIRAAGFQDVTVETASPQPQQADDYRFVSVTVVGRKA